MNSLDDFDKLLKEKAHSDICKVPDTLDEKINSIIIDLPNRKSHKNAAMKISLIAALVAVISVTSVLAINTPTVRNMVNTVISYFNNAKDTRYYKDKTSFEKFNKAIGVSSEDKGIKFTVDNIAVDDNFINVFYTIESKNDINMNFTDENKLFEAVLSTPFFNFKINGKNIKNSNHNDVDAYFEDSKVLKAMSRVNVSQNNLPKNFDLEISTGEIFRTKGNWIISTTIDKSAVAVETKTVKPDIKATIDLGDFKHKITIDKVSISPFGSQIVISERVKSDRLFDKFALFDDKGNVLDVLNTDESISGIGKSTNSFEFLKGNVDMKYITLVPIKFTESKGPANEEKETITKLPINFKTSNTGSRIVDKIEFDKNKIKVTYHNEGVNLWDPAFLFYDADGKQLELGDCGSSTSIDRQNAKYTEIFTFADKNIDFSKIAKIGTFTDKQNLELLKDQAIKINLE